MTHANKYSNFIAPTSHGKRQKPEQLRFMVSPESCAGMMMMESEKNWRDDIAKKYIFSRSTFFIFTSRRHASYELHISWNSSSSSVHHVREISFLIWFHSTQLRQDEDRPRDATTTENLFLSSFFFSGSLKSVASDGLEWRLHAVARSPKQH